MNTRRRRNALSIVTVVLSCYGLAACGGGGNAIPQNAAAVGQSGLAPVAQESRASESLPSSFVHARVIDLGANVSPARLNVRGVVVGSVEPPTGISHAFAYDRGRLISLAKQSTTFSTANDINARNEIVGASGGAGGMTRAAILNFDGSVRFIPNVPNTTIDIANAVNDAGAIGETAYGSSLCMVETSAVYNKGTLRTFGAEDALVALNEQGTIVGAKWSNAGGCDNIAVPIFLPSGAPIPLPSDSDAGDLFTVSLPTDINARGDVVGYYVACAPPAVPCLSIEGFHYHAGATQKTVPVLPEAINTQGWIAGSFLVGTNAANALVPKFNGHRWILTSNAPAGSDPVQHACVLAFGRVIDLNRFQPANSALVLTEATDINDLGEIVGLATAKDGTQHGFLLEL